MLEASGFDFRGRHPQQLLIKLTKFYGMAQDSAVVKTAYGISLDLYRTFAPLKQTTAAMAFACIELAGRLLDKPHEAIESGKDYRSWKINRALVMGKSSARIDSFARPSTMTRRAHASLIETLLDLLELYTHYRTSTVVGPEFAVDIFLEVRIPLNQEVESRKLPRFTEWREPPRTKPNQPKAAVANGNSRPSNPTNGTNLLPQNTSPEDASPSTTTAAAAPGTAPTSNAATTTPNTANGTRTAGRIGERGRDGTVRFMLNPDREQEEKGVVAEYFKPAEEDGDRDGEQPRKR